MRWRRSARSRHATCCCNAISRCRRCTRRAGASPRSSITKQRVKPTEIMHFSRQLGAFVKAGIPIADGLEVISRGTRSKRWREILLTIREEIATGIQFSDALAPHHDILPPYYLGIIRSAELTGRLDTALEQLSEYMERDFETRGKIKSSLMYPSVVTRDGDRRDHDPDDLRPPEVRRLLQGPRRKAPALDADADQHRELHEGLLVRSGCGARSQWCWASSGSSRAHGAVAFAIGSCSGSRSSKASCSTQ